jgi:hypothetical protein
VPLGALAVIYPASKRLAARSNFDGAVWLPRRPVDNLVAVAVAALIGISRRLMAPATAKRKLKPTRARGPVQTNERLDPRSVIVFIDARDRGVLEGQHES